VKYLGGKKNKMEIKKENVEDLVDKGTIKRLARWYFISMDEVKLRIQSYYDAKAVSDMCGSGDSLRFEDFMPPLPVPEGEPAPSVVFNAVVRAREVEADAKKKRELMREMTDKVRKQMGLPPIDWTHRSG
jgi:hypothetical protein